MDINNILAQPPQLENQVFSAVVDNNTFVVFATDDQALYTTVEDEVVNKVIDAGYELIEVYNGHAVFYLESHRTVGDTVSELAQLGIMPHQVVTEREEDHPTREGSKIVVREYQELIEPPAVAYSSKRAIAALASAMYSNTTGVMSALGSDASIELLGETAKSDSWYATFENDDGDGKRDYRFNLMGYEDIFFVEMKTTERGVEQVTMVFPATFREYELSL